MGIYDRDYYRNEGPSYLGSYLSTGKVCMYLVAVNIVVFIAQLVTFSPTDFRRVPPRELTEEELVEFYQPKYGPVTEWLCMKPVETFHQGQIWRLFTGMFLHSPLSHWHIIWNMLWLWWLGRDVEALYGSKEFLTFYLVAGVLGNVLWGVAAFWSPVNEPEKMSALGASGAVMAVQVLATLHFPNRIIYLFWVIPVPLWLVTLIAIAGDLYFFLSGMPTGVGVAAHLGGAGFGAAYWYFQIRLLHLWSDFVSRARRTARPRPRLRVYREEPEMSAGPPAAPERMDRQLASEADRVLEKISRQGKDSLTDEEREILRRASEELRRKRR
jgi:membrane associated rhomboid family serine protease